MAAQKYTQKIVGKSFFAFLNAYKPKTQLIMDLNLISIFPDHMEDYHKIQKQKTLGYYFRLKMISKLTPQ